MSLVITNCLKDYTINFYYHFQKSMSSLKQSQMNVKGAIKYLQSITARFAPSTMAWARKRRSITVKSVAYAE